LEDIKNHIEKIFKGVSYSRTFIEFSNDDYEPLQDISFDYGILEKSKNLKVIKTDFEWMDIGSWESFDYLISADKNNNRLTTKNTLFYDTKNTSIHSKDRLIAAVGLEDIIIVDTNDATLVLNKNKSQEVKTIFQSLKKDHEIYSKFHTKVYRPWGYFDILKETEYFKIKQIFIKPNSAISYQYHEHRNEHWVVISGKATVTKDDSSFILLSQESTYIPKGVKHRLANDENQPLIIIEVQTGDYLGEDDIFRISDDYGR
jgi:mannose-1-phosphate guanylyltransferase/mannose-6-phosphate isomerase